MFSGIDMTNPPLDIYRTRWQISVWWWKGSCDSQSQEDPYLWRRSTAGWYMGITINQLMFDNGCLIVMSRSEWWVISLHCKSLFQEVQRQRQGVVLGSFNFLCRDASWWTLSLLHFCWSKDQKYIFMRRLKQRDKVLQYFWGFTILYI